ncbi:MAG TPA: zinc ribbon domain-containing protein [Ilumatobacteraceae bacterium]|nr:zinc ribbon domain-containing protein [Ilumatobacteraceae bacterium]
MFCHRCGVEVQPKQRFCGDCGVSLTGVTDPTQELIRPSASAPDPLISPSTPSITSPSITGPSITGQLPVTQAVTGVVPTVTRQRDASKRVYDFASDVPDDITHPTERPAPAATPPPVSRQRVPVTAEQVTSAYARPAPTAATTAEMPLLDPEGLRRFRFRLGVVTGTSIVAAIVALVGVFANVVTITTDAVTPTFQTGDWLVGDLGSNLRVAGLIGVGALLVGAVAAGLGVRWGAGLAGGAGLAIAGWAALVIGLVEQPLQAATIAVDAPTTESFTITITRDLGYWLLLASIVIGGAVFVVSLAYAGNDNRSGLNPWIAALGAVSALFAAGGPLVPEGAATFRNNWSSAGGTFDQPTAYLAGRLAQVALLALAGVIGFLQVRRWGLGVAIGGMLPVVWLAVTALLELGDSPVGPAFANPGDTNGDLHAVTVVGMTALVGLAIVAMIAAYDQTVRERP